MPGDATEFFWPLPGGGKDDSWIEEELLGDGETPPEVRKRLKERMRELGYDPNFIR
jgi:hypothetical protein